MSTGAVLHVSLCSLAEVSFRQETRVSGVGLFCIFFWIVLWCVCVYEQATSSGSYIYSYIFCIFYPQIQMNSFQMNTQICFWQYCALPAEERGEDIMYLDYKEGIFQGMHMHA